MAEKRVDPHSGDALSFSELSKKYSGKYKKSEIAKYWDEECKPPKRGKKGKSATEKKAAKQDGKRPKQDAKKPTDDSKKPRQDEKKPKQHEKKGKKEDVKPKQQDEKKGKKGTASPAPKATNGEAASGKDGGGNSLAGKDTYRNCVIAEYVWLDASQTTRSKSMTLASKPRKVEDLRVWNYDGSSTGQADGNNSEVLLRPKHIFDDPFRGKPHLLVLADAVNAWDKKPAKGNTRVECEAIMKKYEYMRPWFGMEQEYTLMMPGKVGEPATQPLGFNADGSEPAPQGPYYTGAGCTVAIGRAVADDHYKKCLVAGVKISGINSEVMPGQWEFQVGPCRGIEMGDHLTVARYIMSRVTEEHNVVCSYHPKPVNSSKWNGAGCHCNFSVEQMRKRGGYDCILKTCAAFGEKVAEHIADYGEDNDMRLTGNCETCSIKDFQFGVANRGASIRIPREAEEKGFGYMEDRRPAANCDPYMVTKRIMQTTGECLAAEEIKKAASRHDAFVFIKPHAMGSKTKEVVKETLEAHGIKIKKQGTIKAERIDKRKLIDNHYGAIAAKAVKLKPADLLVQEKSQEEFKKMFGLSWSEAKEKDLVFNAIDAAKKLGITPTKLGEKYDTLKKGETIIKFGGGFYCGKVDDIYVINGFYMNMRDKFTKKGSSIYFYEVEWEADKLKWADFRGKVLGGTDPKEAPEGSLRNLIYTKWEELGLKACPDTGDNGIHASASPFEALAERSNWLSIPLARDFFGHALLMSDISMRQLKHWCEDPAVDFDGKKQSIFDLLEDTDAGETLRLCKAIALANPVA